MRPALKIIASVLASAALVASSTAAAAASSVASAPSSQVQAPSPWMVLSAMNSNSTRAIALGGANTAAQPGDQPPSPGYTGGPVLNGEIIAFGLWFALIVVALTISGESGRPNSPS